jgi:hypothetical protein
LIYAQKILHNVIFDAVFEIVNPGKITTALAHRAVSGARRITSLGYQHFQLVRVNATGA